MPYCLIFKLKITLKKTQKKVLNTLFTQKKIDFKTRVFYLFLFWCAFLKENYGHLFTAQAITDLMSVFNWSKWASLRLTAYNGATPDFFQLKPGQFPLNMTNLSDDIFDTPIY